MERERGRKTFKPANMNWPALLHLGDCIVNLAHVVRADFDEEVPGGTYFDEDYGKELERHTRPATLTITLVSVEPDIQYDYEGNYIGVAIKSEIKKVTGPLAVRAWGYLGQQCDAFGFSEVTP